MRRKIATIYDNLLSTIGASYVCVCVLSSRSIVRLRKSNKKKCDGAVKQCDGRGGGGGERRAERAKYAE